MEWSTLCEEFSRCVVTAENAADNVGRASTDDGDDDGDAVAALSAELDNALTSLNRKLIELHSRLKGRIPLSNLGRNFLSRKPWLRLGTVTWFSGFVPLVVIP